MQALDFPSSRRSESFYGVVISSAEYNKSNIKIRVLFYPEGKIDDVMKSRLDFAEAPVDLNQASERFLENSPYSRSIDNV